MAVASLPSALYGGGSTLAVLRPHSLQWFPESPRVVGNNSPLQREGVLMAWLSLARSAPGVMVEIIRHPERAVCKIAGHSWDWSTGTLACKQCRWAPVAATNAIIDTLDTLEGACLIADELKKR